MGTVVVPWTDRFELHEGLFRDEIASLLAAGHTHLYVFGTAGEGYAVDDSQFERITPLFVEEMRSGGAEPMAGAISLAEQTIRKRIACARDTLGVRLLQGSLPRRRTV